MQLKQHFDSASPALAHILGVLEIFRTKAQQLPAVFGAIFHAKCAFVTFGATP
jgi:hypothetical protein